MKHMIHLTGVPHPDLPDANRSVFLDRDAIILITPSRMSHTKLHATEDWRQNVQILYEEVERVSHELSMFPPNMRPDSEKEAKEFQRWANRKDIANSLTAAFNMVQKSAAGANTRHPDVDCTEISLSCGTALEHGVMLSRVYVTETPERVIDIMSGLHDPTPPGWQSSFDAGNK